MDQGGGEYTGFIPGVYEGDDSSPIDFQRSITSRSVSGPTTRRLPDPLPGTGGGPDPLAQIGRDMGELAGDGGEDMTSITETALEPGGMSSISEVIQASLPGGEMSVQGGGMPSPYSMRGTSAEEGPGMFSAGAPLAAPNVVGGVSGVPRPEQPFTPAPTGLGNPMGYSMPQDESWSGGWMDEQIPMQSNRHRGWSESAPLARWLRALFSGGGPEHATPSSASSSPSARNPMPGLSSTGSDSLARHYFRS